MKWFWILLLMSGAGVRSAWSEAPRKILMIGDSLTEGYGVTREEAYPALVERKLRENGHPDWTVVNMGVSGSTSSSAPSRMKWALKQNPSLVLLALGANDGLRGLPVKDMEQNLARALDEAKSAKVQVLLVGMQMPANNGPRYQKEFREVFPRLAKKFDCPLVPFLLEGVAGRSDLNQADGVHPTAAGHKVIAETVYRELRKRL